MAVLRNYIPGNEGVRLVTFGGSYKVTTAKMALIKFEVVSVTLRRDESRICQMVSRCLECTRLLHIIHVLLTQIACGSLWKQFL